MKGKEVSDQVIIFGDRLTHFCQKRKSFARIMHLKIVFLRVVFCKTKVCLKI